MSGKSLIASIFAIGMDLRKFTSDFTKNPAFKGSTITGGTLKSDGPGHCLVTFTPSPGHTGRAGFTFTVAADDGRSWTQPCALLVH